MEKHKIRDYISAKCMIKEIEFEALNKRGRIGSIVIPFEIASGIVHGEG